MILRVVTDVYVKEHPDPEVMEKVSEAMRVYARGVVTDIELTGDEHVRPAGAHIHVSSDGVLCQHCCNHGRDEQS